MSKHGPMESCKDYLAKPSSRLEGVLAQCFICDNKFIGIVGNYGTAWWQLIKGEQK